nr:precorrin-6A/cobalt-precorrin-6A reductase [uncultured Celeribacter sp.]
MILLLAGTTEARNLAQHLLSSGVEALAVLPAGSEAENVEDLSGLAAVQVNFAEAEAFQALFDRPDVHAVIDASDPFDAQTTEQAVALSAARSLPYLRYERAGWRSQPGDAWHEVPDWATAGAQLPARAKVFVPVPPGDLASVSALCAQCDGISLQVFADAPSVPQATPLAQGRPSSDAQAVALLQSMSPVRMVLENSGDQAGRRLLSAARHVGVPVLLIARPPQPPAMERREQVLDALEWAEAQDAYA